MQIVELLNEAFFATLEGRNGLPQRVWKNPARQEFANLVRTSEKHDGMRCILTHHDLYFWQSNALLHDDFSKQTGIFGVKVSLRAVNVMANLETVGSAEQFPWVFARFDIEQLDMDQRQAIVEQWLHDNDRLQRAYNGPTFEIVWYQ
jgi:hypothetical protein